MRLITAHRILIGSAAAFFAGFAAFQLYRYTTSGAGSDVTSGVLGAVAAVGFAIYLRSIWRR